MDSIRYETIKVRVEGTICFIQIYRPEDNNTVNDQLVEEFNEALCQCEETITVVVVEGLPEVFCFGVDFKSNLSGKTKDRTMKNNPEPIYDLWSKLVNGPFISIAHVRGKVNAGGIGFVAACDVVLADEAAQFSLSELLFGLMPACVMPFLIRRIGFQKAHYLTVMTQPISSHSATAWGLVDACDSTSEDLLRKHLLRLRRLSKTAITRYKKYIKSLDKFLLDSKPIALQANREVFSDIRNIKGIYRYVEEGIFPWEN